jgi:8-oxo-dGTP diphosphatase
MNAKLAADVVLFALGVDRELEITDVMHVLVIQRRWDPFAGRWALPGGHVDSGETFQAAARRELLEETGITAPTMLAEAGVWDAPGRDPRGRVISVAFTGVADRMELPTAADDAAAAEWIPVHRALAEDALAFDHGQILQRAVTVAEQKLGWWLS